MKKIGILFIGMVIFIVACVLPVSAFVTEEIEEQNQSDVLPSGSNSEIVPVVIGETTEYYPNMDTFVKAMKAHLAGWYDSYKDLTYIPLDTSNWTDEMLTSVISAVTHNTAWTPDERLEYECVLMGWDKKMVEWNEYKNGYEKARMEAEMEAMEQGIEFDEATFKNEFEMRYRPTDGYTLDEGEAYYDIYLNKYFDHYMVTGDYGRDPSKIEQFTYDQYKDYIYDPSHENN